MAIRFPDSESARLATLFVALFVAMTGALVAAVLWIAADTERGAILEADRADLAAIESGYRDEGAPEAIEVVRQLLGSPARQRQRPVQVYVVLVDDVRGALAGNLDPPPTGEGPIERRGPAGPILGEWLEVAPGLRAFVARDASPIGRVRWRILGAFAWVVGGAVVLAVLGGLWFGRRFMRRVDAIARTCESIAAGRFTERIGAHGGGREWRRLVAAIDAMLEHIDVLVEDLRQVSSDVAHDLRTPLARLRGRLEAARRESASSADYAVAVDAAIADSERILEMFQAVLRISEIEAGARARAFTDLSLTALLGEVVDMYRPVAEDAGQSLDLELQTELRIAGDRELLVQLFGNLIENAIRHTPAGTRIVVGAGRADGTIEAFVSDDGPGIAAEERGRVLKRFYRVSNSRSAPGHGLGLALVAAIAARHRARLALADAGPGLRVTLCFPVGGPP